MQNGTSNGAVYLQTNDASRNEIVAYRRRADGSLARIGDYETGGRGSGNRSSSATTGAICSSSTPAATRSPCSRSEATDFA